MLTPWEIGYLTGVAVGIAATLFGVFVLPLVARVIGHHKPVK